MALSGFRAFGIRAIPQTITSSQYRHLHRCLSSATSTTTSGGSGVAMAVKKVTLSNFCSVLEDLRIRIREADFVAIDLEMTGVTSAPWRDSFEFDRSDVRYLKVKDSAEKFAVVQFGLCTFRWDACQGSFIAHPLNFYIFPRKELSVEGPTNEFLCQTTSISFLAKYQFDFNACIHEGISYLSKTQEEEALHNLCSAYENALLGFSSESEEYVEIPAVRTADVFFTERMKIRFHEWRENVLKYPEDPILKGNDCGQNVDFQMVFFKMHPAIMLNGFTSHQLKLIQLVLRKYFKDLLYLCVSGENCSSQKLVVYTDSEEDRASLMQEVKEDQLRSGKLKIHSAVGFRHVIDLLMCEEKLIVGHNCFLDIAHIYKKFIGPLPSLMEEFALSVNKILPHIIDTKHLISSNHFIQYLMKKKNKSLSSAFSLLCPQLSSASQNLASTRSFVKVDVQADELGSSSWNSGAKHEAGFDAFMTGCVFAQACSHLGIKFEQDSSIMDLARNDNLKNYINILYPSWNSGTVIDLRTGAESPVSCYKRKYPKIEFANIALIWGFSSKLKPKDMEECLCKVFGTASVITVFFLDRTAALIQFNKMERVNDFLVLKDMLEKDDGPVSVLHPLAKLLEGGNTHAADYNTYRDICSSSMSTSKILFADQAEAIGIRWKTKIRSACKETSELDVLKDPVSEHQTNKNVSEMQSQHQFSFEEMLNSL
ncbi:hypothetical protein IEQ34_008972 [Dendrobium chrysotoxum]|uniref:Uncharacterized protein n=1 Tax=Dendrobium chrysotoxum TaxID=161865 RepID=A0AAV7GY07_DENCH|nr:hypothetical protein IEQ34_008972 [Dendrobium chrysotoxum]